jgi:hypothetical protein
LLQAVRLRALTPPPAPAPLHSPVPGYAVVTSPSNSSSQAASVPISVRANSNQAASVPIPVCSNSNSPWSSPCKDPDVSRSPWSSPFKDPDVNRSPWSSPCKEAVACVAVEERKENFASSKYGRFEEYDTARGTQRGEKSRRKELGFICAYDC